LTAGFSRSRAKLAGELLATTQVIRGSALRGRSAFIRTGNFTISQVGRTAIAPFSWSSTSTPAKTRLHGPAHSSPSTRATDHSFQAKASPRTTSPKPRLRPTSRASTTARSRSTARQAISISSRCAACRCSPRIGPGCAGSPISVATRASLSPPSQTATARSSICWGSSLPLTAASPPSQSAGTRFSARDGQVLSASGSLGRTRSRRKGWRRDWRRAWPATNTSSSAAASPISARPLYPPVAQAVVIARDADPAGSPPASTPMPTFRSSASMR
jgi:hypothetical protein